MFKSLWLKRAFIVIATFTIVSCSVVTLGYNRLPLLTILELNSTNKGFLPPRMTAYPSSPAIGLTIYRTDLNGYFTWNGTAWTQNVFGVSGSSLPCSTVSTSTYTLTSADAIICLNSSSNQTLTLPAASTLPGKTYWIINVNNFSRNINDYKHRSVNFFIPINNDKIFFPFAISYYYIALEMMRK